MERVECDDTCNNLFSGVVLGNISEMEKIDTCTSTKENGSFFNDFAKSVNQSYNILSVQPESLGNIFGYFSINQSLSESFQEAVTSGDAPFNDALHCRAQWMTLFSSKPTTPSNIPIFLLQFHMKVATFQL
jgi:hypothetical protein